MNKHKSFQEILQEKVELSAKNTHSAHSHFAEPAYLSYLIGKIRPFDKTVKVQPKEYFSFQPRPQPIAKTRTKHSFRPEQEQARQFFIRWGHPLYEDFTTNELKKAYRHLALRLHPDRGTQDAQAFLDLKFNYDLLKSVFSSSV